MKIQFIALIVLTSLIVSCRPKVKNTENQILMDEVMVIHDEVMPKMKDIHELKKEVRTYQDGDSLTQIEVNALLLALSKADESMMDWMADFKPPKEADLATEKAYLEKEKNKISQVSEEMLNSINKATEFLNEKKKDDH